MGYDLAAWSGFFTAASTVTGALLGLMIAAITVRITLLETDHDLSIKVFSLLVVLFFILMYALVPLAPIGRLAIGIVLAILGADIVGFFAYYVFAAPRPSLWSRAPSISIYFPYLLISCLLVVGGVSLAVRGGGGLYWVIPGLLFTLGQTLGFLWMLMVSPKVATDEDRPIDGLPGGPMPPASS